MPWSDGLDEATLGHASLNGWKADTNAEEVARAAVAAHLATQKQLGAPVNQFLRLPADANDKEGYDRLYGALGAAKDPAEYKFEGIDEKLHAPLREAAHELHLSPAAAAELGKRVAALGAVDQNAAAEAARAKATSDDLALRQSWGGNYDAFKATVDRAAALMGLTPEDVATMAGTKLGYVATMERLRGLAVRLGEAPLHLADKGGSAGASPLMNREEAIAKRAELYQDQAFLKRYLTPTDPGHKEATELMLHINRKISEIAMPTGGR